MAEREIAPVGKMSDAAQSGAAATGGDAGHELNCSSCGAALLETELFERFRICPVCGRHFSLPARERLTLLVDPGSFIETNAALVSAGSLVFRDQLPAPDRLAEIHERSALADAVITGSGIIGGHAAMLIVLDFSLLGRNIGLLVGEKIALAMESAVAKRLPLIAICSGGGARTQSGVLGLFQIGKMAAEAARLRRDGIPIISVLTHPTTGGVYVGLANQADLILAERGALIGFSPAQEARSEVPPETGASAAETMLGQGLIDALVSRVALRETIARVLDLLGNHGRMAAAAAPVPAAGLATVPWEAANLARHQTRPTARAYITRMIPEFIELHGDRTAMDDPAMICGLGRLGGGTVAIVAQERVTADLGAARPRRVSAAGYRKAARILRLASQLELPVVTLIDLSCPRDGEEADEPSLGMAIAQTLNLRCMLPVPMISVVIGESAGASGLALALGDRMLMQEHAIYVVPGRDVVPTRPAERAGDAAPGLILTARDCLRLGLIDGIVAEPAPAAHADPVQAADLLGMALVQALTELPASAPRRLLEARERRLRTIGQATPEGQETAQREMTELQKLQRAVARSLDELREGWEARNRSLPKLNLNLSLHRPDLTDLAGRFAALKEGATARRPELGRGATPSEPPPEAREEPPG